MRKGITLIMLTVTIIVLSLLTTVVVMEIMDNDIQSKAYTTVFKADLNTFISEFDIKKANCQMLDISFDETTINATWEGTNNSSIVTWIPSFTEEYKDKLIIQNGDIVYIGSDETEQAIIEQLHIASGYYVEVPSTYTQLEYLESSGTQYINTGIAPTETLSFDCTFENSNITGSSPGCGNIFGSRTSSGVQEYQLSFFNNGMISIGRRNSQLNFNTFGKHRIIFDGNTTITIDGIPTTILKNSITQQNNIILFAISSGGVVTQCQAGRIYHVSFGNVRNFIPVKRNSDNELGMYDTVYNLFYEKQGEGSFIPGPEVQ